MSNKQRALVEIKLDKPRRIRFTLNSLAEIEDRLGVKMDQLEKVHMGMKEVRTMLWAGLIHEDEELTENQVGNMVDFDNIQYIQEKVGEAFQRATAKNSPNGLSGKK